MSLPLDPGDARMKRTYVSALLVQAAVLCTLWVLGRYFS
jgi:hypothetical protein